MNIDDFRYMRCGKQIRPLEQEEASVLATVDKRGLGKKRALLLLHGFSSSPAVFRTLWPSLAQYDAVVCPLLPGHGDSILAFAAVKSSEWLSAAEQACEDLINSYQAVDVLGLSLGGLLACHLSQKFALHHLFLLAPALALQLHIPRSLLLAYVLQRLGFKYLRNRAGNLQKQDESELAYRLLPITTIVELLTLIRDFELIQPTCPTDVFLGRYDKVTHSNWVATHLENQPNISIHWLEHSAHILPLDNDAAVIMKCLEQSS